LNRKKVLLLAWVTLLIFPLPVWGILYYFEDFSISQLLQVEKIGIIEIGYGLQFGFVYAFFASIILQAPIFKQLPLNLDKMISSMKITRWDALFISFCAGFGEEVLFRVGMQHYLGIIITSILFVAIHGYLNPFNWRYSLYGVVVLPFVLLLSWGFESFGLWFAISAHFSYDAVLFWSHIKNVKAPNR